MKVSEKCAEIGKPKYTLILEYTFIWRNCEWLITPARWAVIQYINFVGTSISR